MKNLKLLSAVIVLTSCAFHSGTITSNLTTEPVIHKDIAVGVASTNIFLTFGGLSKDALISEARKNMVRARPLEGSEQYNNIEVNIKNTYYVFGRKTKVTINADVIQPKDSINQASYSANYLTKIAHPEPKHGLFGVGDSVLVYNGNSQSGEIVGFMGDDLTRVEVNYTDSKKAIRTKKVSENNVFVPLKEHRGVTLFMRTQDGIIVGFGINRILVKTYEGYIRMNYPKANTGLE